MTLRYGAALCYGVASKVNPKKPAIVCIDCERRLMPPAHAWQKYLEPAPARHDGSKWVCERRVEK